MNEASPAFSNGGSYTVSALAEERTSGTSLTISPGISATDADTSDQLTFSLTGKLFI